MTGLTVTPLHHTFGAELGGADLRHPTPELMLEIRSLLSQVRPVGCGLSHRADPQYGVLVCRDTGLDDDTHVAMSRMLGELDDVTPCNKLGRINRLKYDE